MFYFSVKDFVAAAATIYQECHLWPRLRTEDQELFAFLF